MNSSGNGGTRAGSPIAKGTRNGHGLLANDGHRENAGQLGELLDLLGIEPDERVSICSQKPGGSFDATVPLNRSDAEALALSYVKHRDVWFGVNPVALPEGYRGRGTDQHVTRCVALFDDIDIRIGGVADSEIANEVTKGIASALGQNPTLVVDSGHGGHPYWALDPDDDEWVLDTADKRAAAVAVYRRFQRLSADIAGKFGGSVDNVGQLSRILRVPGTFNRKDPGKPIQVKLCAYPYGSSGPLSYREVIDALDAYGVLEYPEDREQLGEMLSTPDDWRLGTETRPYVVAMIDGWRNDLPASRHGWLVSQAVRLACAHRLGLITAGDHDKANQVLADRFVELLETHGQRRKPTPGEVAGALAWGVQRAASKFDEQAADEIGGQWDEAADEARKAEANRALNERLTLPDDYWNAHPVLAHIRQAARASGNSPDGVLGALHAEIAARVHPGTRLDTGLKKPTTLNAFTLLADDQGGGKSSAMEESEDLIVAESPTLPSDPMDSPDGITVDREVFRAGAFGSGEGIAAQYVELRPVNPLRPKGPKRNVQVRSNVLFTVDEGESMVAELQKPTSKFGSEFRAAWSGRRLGQGNAKEENRRPVHPGQYAIGACIGIQTVSMRELQTDHEHRKGTVPRLDAYWMPDPAAPDVRPPHPGKLQLDLRRFAGGLVLCDELKATIERQALRHRRGEVSADHDRHQYLSIARRAGRLMILCSAVPAANGSAAPVAEGHDDAREQVVVEKLFWTLAEMEYERSAQIKAHAEALIRDERKALADGRVRAAVDRETAIDDSRRTARLSREEQIRGRISRFLAKYGPTPWAGKQGIWQRAKNAADDRTEWEQVRDQMVDDEALVLSGNVYSRAED